MKYKIEKNTVQETLIIPLFARKVCSELYPNLYRDETAIRLIDEIDYDFSDAEKKSHSLMQRFGALEVAMRQNDLAWEVRDYLKSHPTAHRGAGGKHPLQFERYGVVFPNRRIGRRGVLRFRCVLLFPDGTGQGVGAGHGGRISRRRAGV